MMYFNYRFYIQTYCCILFIVGILCLGLTLIVTHTGIIIGCLLVVISFFVMSALAKRLNKFNIRLRLFIDAVGDKENMLQFNERTSDEEMNAFSHLLNRINDLLALAKVEGQKQERFYLSLLEEVPNGILAWNAKEKIILANSSALRLLGSEHLVWLNQLQQLYPSLTDWLGEHRRQSSFLLHSIHKQQLSLSINQMKLEEEVITLLSIKDISNELSEKESESWSKLTHVLTHEIMNTIAPIASLSQTLLTYTDLDQKVARGLNIIRAQSERLMEFTDSYRHLSYLPEPEKKRFSLTNMLHTLELLMQTDFELAHVAFTLHTCPQEILMEGDEKQLSQVFLNLLKNSLQALENNEKGEIAIEIKEEEKLLISITDNGPGIPPDLQEQVFVPFFTTKAEGMGIGLSLCKQIIKRHGGSFELRKSRPGQTTFVIEYPKDMIFSTVSILPHDAEVSLQTDMPTIIIDSAGCSLG